MKSNKTEIAVGVITALSAAALATCCFSLDTKRQIIERDGGEKKCSRCGKTPEDGVEITFHHVIPEFFLKKVLGINPDQAQFGVMLCRHPCHDEADKRLLANPEYSKYLRGGQHEKAHRVSE